MTPRTPDARSGRRIAVVVASTDPTPAATASLSAFAAQVGGRGEVVLVDSSRDASNREAARGLANVRVLRRPAGTLAPELWRDGWQATDAPLVAFSTAMMVPDPGWLDALHCRLLETGAVAVGGSIEPAEGLGATDRAVYLLRYSNYLGPDPMTPAPSPAGDNALYRRDAVADAGCLLADGFWEVEVHRQLLARGGRLARADDAVVTFHGGSRLAPTLVQRFRHGQRYGATRGTSLSRAERLARGASAPLVPGVLFRRIAANLRARGRPIGPWWTALTPLALLASAWAWGEASGLLVGPRTRTFGHNATTTTMGAGLDPMVGAGGGEL